MKGRKRLQIIRWTSFVWLLVGIMAGYSTHYIMWYYDIMVSRDALASKHSAKLQQYIDVMRNQENWKQDTGGLVYAEEPFDLNPTLAVLVSLGELEHIDVVLPTVPYSRESAVAVNRFLMTHEDIVYCRGNADYRDFPIRGHPPLHLRLWFRKSGTDDVRLLIARMQDGFGHVGSEER